VDLVISLAGIGLRFLKNNGTGYFTVDTETWFPDLGTRFGDAMSIAAADFNGDGAVRALPLPPPSPREIGGRAGSLPLLDSLVGGWGALQIFPVRPAPPCPFRPTQTDLYVGGSVLASSRLLMNVGFQYFTPKGTLRAEGVNQNAIVVADLVDFDGLPDVFVCSSGANRLFPSGGPKGLAAGAPDDVAAAFKVADSLAPCVDASVGDLDLDGRWAGC
jgi:hypothetical protein